MRPESIRGPHEDRKQLDSRQSPKQNDCVMLFVVSPAKTLDVDSPVPTTKGSEPRLGDQASMLVPGLRRKSIKSLMDLMSISPELAELNRDRFRAWEWPHHDEDRQALWMFKGDVYLGLEAETLKAAGIKYAQEHLRILSGLYGILRPLDRIMPYRLEMGTKLKTRRGSDLYQFWRDRVRKLVEEDLKADGTNVLVNLASNEYFKVLQPNKLKADVITPVFKDWNRDQFRVLSFFAKKARGMMARYAIDQRLEDPEQLKEFDREGYAFNEDFSSESEWVFTRTGAPEN